MSKKTGANQLESTAEYFIYLGKQSSRSNRAAIGITNKKLQKLVYYAQAWHLVFKKKPLFQEPIEAWIHGPVIPKLYHQYKHQGFQVLDIPSDYDPGTAISKNIKLFLDEVWRVYGKYDADYLELLTHSESPWIEAREIEGLDNVTSKTISIESMQTFYTTLYDSKKKQI